MSQLGANGHSISRAIVRVPTSSAVLLVPLFIGVVACAGPEPEPAAPAVRPDDVPALHHVGLNSVDPGEAAAWYQRIWPSAELGEMAGRTAVSAEMHILIDEVASPPPGAFDPALGRPAAQSAFWHIGAFANTTEMDAELGALGIDHLPLYLGPDGDASVWRSGLAPYSGTRTADQLADAEPSEPRAGGFSYVVAPDGVLFEFTGGPGTDPSLSHIHLFHEQPQCAANWYVSHLGMSLPPVRGEDGESAVRPPYDPCEEDPAEAGWPSLERVGTIRGPRATVVHGSASVSIYPRQCVGERCGSDQPLVPSRGQALDHIGFSVEDIDAWHAWLVDQGVTILEEPEPFDDRRAFMIEGPDGLAIELVGPRAAGRAIPS